MSTIMRQRANDAGSQPGEVTGRMVLICLVAFFALVAGVNAIMIRFAVSTFGGVETESAYQAGRAFARETAAVAMQDTLHWQVKGRVSTTGDATHVEVAARDAGDRPLAGLQVEAWLTHPTDRRLDQVVTLAEATPGTFAGQSAPLAGQWTLVIELSRDGSRLYRSKNRIFLR
jgi:nitrogen fixation protein FixH